MSKLGGGKCIHLLKAFCKVTHLGKPASYTDINNGMCGGFKQGGGLFKSIFFEVFYRRGV